LVSLISSLAYILYRLLTAPPLLIKLSNGKRLLMKSLDPPGNLSLPPPLFLILMKAGTTYAESLARTIPVDANTLAQAVKKLNWF
jgi:hypothetical protein